jgi:hypothetical protein
MPLDKELGSLFLPEGLLVHFDIIDIIELCDIKTKKLFYTISIEEKNEIIGIHNGAEFKSKGFSYLTLQDFPIRGKAVYLKIGRRKWQHKINPKIFHRNDFSYVAVGSGFTKELADFLKDRGR